MPGKKKKRRRRLQKTRRYIVYLLTIFIRRILLVLPFRFSFHALSGMGVMAYYLLPRERRLILENLERAFGDEKTPGEKKRIAKEVFRNAGRTLAEVLCWPKLGIKHLISNIKAPNIEILEKAFDKGKGLIGLTAHFGNWEFLAAWMGMVQKYPFSVIVRKYSNPHLDRLLKENRQSMGVEMIYRGQGAIGILKRLKRGGALGILADQNIRGEGIFVDFFGHKAKTLKNMAELIRKTGIDVIPMFIIRNKDLTTHTLIIENPLAFPLKGNKDEDQKIIAQTYTAVIESYVRKFPEQWMWMHPRWGKNKT